MRRRWRGAVHFATDAPYRAAVKREFDGLQGLYSDYPRGAPERVSAPDRPRADGKLSHAPTLLASPRYLRHRVALGAAARHFGLDLFAFRWVASPQISPDGRQSAYVLVTVNAKHDGYETSL